MVVKKKRLKKNKLISSSVKMILGRKYHYNVFVYKILRRIFGIGFISEMKKICCILGITLKTRVKNLSKPKISALESLIYSTNFYGKGLRRRYNVSMQRLRVTGCLRGRRLLLGLPVRGQRTHTNRKTAKRLNYKMFMRVF